MSTIDEGRSARLVLRAIDRLVALEQKMIDGEITMRGVRTEIKRIYMGPLAQARIYAEFTECEGGLDRTYSHLFGRKPGGRSVGEAVLDHETLS